jgi:hypothetical protein
VLDVAPVDTLHSLSTHFVKHFPPELLSDDMKSQSLPFEFHWVSSSGAKENRHLTGGITIVPTVCLPWQPSDDATPAAMAFWLQ